MGFSEDFVFRLAPDPGTFERGRQLAIAERWLKPVGNGRGIWAGVRSPVGAAFMTAVGLLPQSAFFCTCPVARKPCKHGLGLFLLFLRKPEIFGVSDPEGEVAQWLAKREAQPQKPEYDEAKRSQLDADRAKRREERLETMRAGLDDLRLWMHDLAKTGVGNLLQQGPELWHGIAARCADAKLVGFAAQFRAIAFVHREHPDDVGTISDRLADIWLAVRCFDRFDSLTPDQRDDLLAVAGVRTTKNDLEPLSGVTDIWTVVGQRHGRSEDDLNPIHWRRVWLYGEQSKRWALLLDFAPPGFDYERHWPTDTIFRGELVYYPSAAPMRASVRSGSPADPTVPPQATDRLEAVLHARAEAMSANPWQKIRPCLLEGRLAQQANGTLFFVDAGGQSMPVVSNETSRWQLLAQSAGGLVMLCCELDGSSLMPLSVRAGDHWVDI